MTGIDVFINRLKQSVRPGTISALILFSESQCLAEILLMKAKNVTVIIHLPIVPFDNGSCWHCWRFCLNRTVE
jgi:hypothetical protein